MTLIDTGPLVALIDTGQGETHQKWRSVVHSLSTSLITSWACFTEAMYFLGRLQGWYGQSALWQYVENDELSIHPPAADEWRRIRELMNQYRDTPMDLADASLVSLAELRGLRRILTIDNDFYVYRINGKDSFDVIMI